MVTCCKSEHWSPPVKNLFVVSVSIMLLFLASQSMDKLQSSVNFEKGLGTTSLAVLNGASIIGSFLAAVFIRQFGPKLVLLISMSSFVAYIAVNLHATWYTMIPVFALNGLCSATLYTSIWTYLGTLGSQYSERKGLSKDLANARFYGIFFMFNQSSVIWGNLISSKVLQQQDDLPVNNSNNEYCGYNFCDDIISEDDSKFTGTPQHFYLLCYIFIGVSILAILVMLLADKQEPQRLNENSTIQNLLATGKILKEPNMILGIPITIYCGLQFAFINGDYTKAYITCEFDVSNVGNVFICFGVVSTIFSAVTGHLVKTLGRKVVFIMCFLIDVAVYLCLFTHQFQSSQGLLLIYVLVGCLGITSSVWEAQVKALYGSLFSERQEVAFSMLGVFESAGLALGFLYSAELCTRPKLLILFGTQVLGMICYGFVEVRQARNVSKTKTSNTGYSVNQ